MNFFSHEYFMKQALYEAHMAFDNDEVPVGAVIVARNRIIARAFNRVEQLHDVTAHAEIQAITSASEYTGGKYLRECSLYVTLEPCIMCAGALYWSQIGQVIFGANDDKRGFMQIGTNVLHPKTEIISGILTNECSDLLKQFFLNKRK